MSKMIHCKTCGAEIAANAKACPACGAKNKKPVFKRWWFWVIVVFLVLAAVAPASNKAEKVGSVDTTKTNSSSTTTPAPTVQSAFTVGDQVKLNDIVVTLNDAYESSGAQYVSPNDGNTFLICEFTIENNSPSDIAVSSLMSFEAYVDDFSTNLSLSAIVSQDGKKQLDGSVAAGKKMNGIIGYELPIGWQEFEVRFTPSFWSGRDITFVVNR